LTRDVGRCLAGLERVAEAAERLGLDASGARQAVESARTRLGFPGTAFVLALAGGTGAGKSSLLNALAGAEVSRPGPVRPVTAEPVAWAPADAAGELGPLLRWVGVERVVSHHDPAFADLCLLDLPDYDSVERAHRARVDEVLPRVDAVCWVLDPEKYNDRVLHEDYLRPLAHHAERAVFVVNRRDVIGGPEAVAELVADVRRTLAADGIAGRPVFAVSALPPDGAGTGELDALRAWLSGRMQAKSIVADRVAADCAAAGAEIARRAGLEGEGANRPLVDERTRAAAREQAVAAARAAVDVAGVRRACQRRTRAEAQASGAGPVGRALGGIARLRGGREAAAVSARSIDPVAYARGWRGRASLSRTVNPVHDLLRRAAVAAPPALRADVMALARPDRLEERLGDAIDGAVTRAGVEHARPPRSWLWPLIGGLQTLATAALLAGVLWYATLYLAGRAQADLPDLPTYGDVPVPLLLVVGGLVGGWLLARLLSASARRQGRRWADRFTRDLDRAVSREVDRAMSAPLAELEAARSDLLVRLADLRQAAG
jgi:energy-coupling factor transporter ATP-binding protein EcfA2